MRKNNYGNDWELKICSFLEDNGINVLERNFTVKGGETDIIANDGKYICFIEVKFRSDRAIDAYSSVGYRKRRRIIKSAEKYLVRTGCSLQPRFDVIFIFSDGDDIDIDYIKNAYDGSVC